ncbi:MAG: exopolyphosphatase, partial [Pseudorhodobacter sp.]|nr:exopolyphosphatase [Pseudorhodobacter sp.]
LGLALLHRYKNSHTGSRLEPLFRLLSDQDVQDAEVLGKAMRFGAMFSIADPETAGALRWQPKKRVLELVLTPRGQGLMGEVAEARFNALVLALKAKGQISRAGAAAC